MYKKRGIFAVALIFLLFSISSVFAADDIVREDVIVGLIVVAIILMIVIIAMIMLIKKKHKHLGNSAEKVPAPVKYEPFQFHEEIPVRLEEMPHMGHPEHQPSQSSGGGFLARARQLQKPQQTQQYEQKPEEQQETTDSASIIPQSKEKSNFQMKVCHDCGFEVIADEKTCPVCGKKI